jgi:allantoinase
LELSRLVDWMSKRPAELVGVPRKGAIEVGGDADFAVFAPDQPFTVDVTTLHHRHPISPYDGQELTGVVRATYLRGEPITGTAPRGTFVRPEGP